MPTSTEKKVTGKKAAAKPAKEVIKKPRVSRAQVKKEETVSEMPMAAVSDIQTPSSSIELTEKPTISGGRYVFATGRRKTAVATVRMFSGSGEIQINRKPFDAYFSNPLFRQEAVKPLHITGLLEDFYFTATVNGGGIKAQAEAVRHGIAQALAGLSLDLRKILKKNGFLTRDDRKKERKKPGLKRARRSPQWAKR